MTRSALGTYKSRVGLLRHNSQPFPSTHIYGSMSQFLVEDRGCFGCSLSDMSTMCRKRNIFFYADFNLGQLLQLAERLRCQPCTCDDSQTPKAGALNWVIFLEFDDGVEWVFRAPCSFYTAAQGVTGRLLASEAATLKYIREHTSIPVPEVFHYSYLP